MLIMSIMLTLLLASRATAEEQTCTATAGQYCPQPTGAAATCPAGYYCTGEAPYESVACPTGTHNPTPGGSDSSVCEACGAGLAALAVGQAECHTCPAGSIFADASTCTGCPAGQFAAEGAGTCSACVAGTWLLAFIYGA
jgi:hypothetical protein